MHIYNDTHTHTSIYSSLSIVICLYVISPFYFCRLFVKLIKQWGISGQKLPNYCPVTIHTHFDIYTLFINVLKHSIYFSPPISLASSSSFYKYHEKRKKKSNELIFSSLLKYIYIYKKKRSN